VTAEAEAAQLDQAAERSAAIVRRDIQRASNYVLGVVLFAVALFFAGMSSKLESRCLRRATSRSADPSSSEPSAGSRRSP
jgi:hypothetical protein